MKKQKKFFVLIFLGLAVLLLVGCTPKMQERATEKMVEDLTGGEVKLDLDGNQVKVETQHGATEVGDSLKISADFPSDVYIVEGAIKAAYKNAESTSWTLTIEADKSVEEIKNLYEKELVKTGWKRDNLIDMGEVVTAGYLKNNRIVSLMISLDSSSNTTMVILDVSGRR